MYRSKHMYRRLRDSPGVVMPGIPQCTVVPLKHYIIYDIIRFINPTDDHIIWSIYQFIAVILQ